jgi:hypothetical protein
LVYGLVSLEISRADRALGLQLEGHLVVRCCDGLQILGVGQIVDEPIEFERQVDAVLVGRRGLGVLTRRLCVLGVVQCDAGVVDRSLVGAQLLGGRGASAGQSQCRLVGGESGVVLDLGLLDLDCLRKADFGIDCDARVRRCGAGNRGVGRSHN